MLSEYLNKLIFMNQITKSDLVKQLGVTRQTFYNWINSIHAPSFSHIMSIAELLADNEDEVESIARQVWICLYEDHMNRYKEIKNEVKNG